MKTVPVVRFTVLGRDQRFASAEVGMGRPWVVIYDGYCRVCGRLANVLRRWDRRQELEIVPSQAPGVAARFPWIPDRAFRESLQLVGPGGETLQGAAAVERLLDILPRGGLLGWVFKLPFGRRLADRFYRWFARNRYRLGCGEHCQLRPVDLDFHEAERQDGEAEQQDGPEAPVTPAAPVATRRAG